MCFVTVCTDRPWFGKFSGSVRVGFVVDIVAMGQGLSDCPKGAGCQRSDLYCFMQLSMLIYGKSHSDRNYIFKIFKINTENNVLCMRWNVKPKERRKLRHKISIHLSWRFAVEIWNGQGYIEDETILKILRQMERQYGIKTDFIYLFICSLFNDAFWGTHTIQRRIEESKVNAEMGRMWKKTVLA
jgi:hypothetical protein